MKEKKFSFFGIEKIAPFMKKHRRALVTMVACGLIGSAVDIMVPLFQRYALNHFIGENTLDTLVYFILIYASTIILVGLANYVACYLALATEVRTNRDLRNAAFSHLQTLSFSYYNQNSVGYIYARVMSDTSRIGGLVSWNLMDCVWHMTYLVGAVAVMFAINAKLALLVVSIVPLIAILFALFEKNLIKVNREVREINSKITGNLNEGITGAKTIKTLVVEDKIEADFKKDTAEMRKKSVRAAKLSGLFGATMNFASSLALAIVLWRGGYIAVEEVGTFSMFMSYAQGMMEPVRWLTDAITALITSQVNIERFHTLVTMKSDVVDTPEVIEKYGDTFNPKKENWEEIHGDIEFENVDF